MKAAKTATATGVKHNVAEQLTLQVGATYGNYAVNGYYYAVTYAWGSGNTLASVDGVSSYLEGLASPEEDLSNCVCGGSFLTAEHDFTGSDEGFDVYWPEDHDTP